MNILRLKIATQEYVSYSYFPEDKGVPGEIHMKIGDEKASVVSRAENDTDLGRYAHYAAKAIEELVERKRFPLEHTQAWG